MTVKRYLDATNKKFKICRYINLLYKYDKFYMQEYAYIYISLRDSA